MPLVYVDLLGVKSHYARGVNAARKRFQLLEEIVSDGLSALPANAAVGGGIQSDGAAVQLSSVEEAIEVGREIFVSALNRSKTTNRIWIRGVIVDGPTSSTRLVREKPLNSQNLSFKCRYFGDDLLRAIALEQSGFKGQRLLIEQSLVSASLRKKLAIVVGHGTISPTHKLRYSQPVTKFEDVLWPVPTGQLSNWKRRYIRLSDRVRHATEGGEDEVKQAFATHLLFSEIDSMIHANGGPSAMKN